MHIKTLIQQYWKGTDWTTVFFLENDRKFYLKQPTHTTTKTVLLTVQVPTYKPAQFSKGHLRFIVTDESSFVDEASHNWHVSTCARRLVTGNHRDLVTNFMISIVGNGIRRRRSRGTSVVRNRCRRGCYDAIHIGIVIASLATWGPLKIHVVVDPPRGNVVIRGYANSVPKGPRSLPIYLLPKSRVGVNMIHARSHRDYNRFPGSFGHGIRLEALELSLLDYTHDLQDFANVHAWSQGDVHHHAEL